MTPGIEQAIADAVKAALTESQQTGRYEIVVLVAIFLITAGLLVWVVKHITDQSSRHISETLQQAVEREKILSKRIDDLEEYIRTEFAALIRENKEALNNHITYSQQATLELREMNNSLYTTRTCFLSGERQKEIVDTIAARVADKAGRE